MKQDITVTEACGDESEELAMLLPKATHEDASMQKLKQHSRWDYVVVLINQLYSVQHNLINQVGDNLSKDYLERKCQQLKEELSNEDSLPIESLLIERIVTCWLQLYLLEIQHPQDIPTLNYLQKAITAASKRFCGSINQLCLVRRLAVPVLLQQINIMKQEETHRLKVVS